MSANSSRAGKVAVIYGTTGEMIKLAPVIRALAERDAVITLCTGQQATQIKGMASDLGMPTPDIWLAKGFRGRDLGRTSDIPVWAATMVGRTATASLTALRREARAIVVHGDTLTTALAAITTRLARLPIAHIEAGLRSGSYRNPFPEELNRRVASRCARIHYAPGDWAVDNLRRARVRGDIVNTERNTIVDALRIALSRADSDLSLSTATRESDFGLVSLHRFELLERRSALEQCLRALHEAADQRPLVFIDHSVTADAVRRHHLDHLLDHPRITRIPRQRYTEFIQLLIRSQFLFTDSGGSQEECAALGIPCLIHRARTERPNGLDEGTVILSQGNMDTVRKFLGSAHLSGPRRSLPDQSPTATILGDLEARGLILRRCSIS